MMVAPIFEPQNSNLSLMLPWTQPNRHCSSSLIQNNNNSTDDNRRNTQEGLTPRKKVFPRICE